MRHEERLAYVRRIESGESMTVIAREAGVLRQQVAVWVERLSKLSTEDIKWNRLARNEALKIEELRALKDSGAIRIVGDVPVRLQAHVEAVFTEDERREMHYRSYIGRNVRSTPTEEVLEDIRRVAKLIAPKVLTGPLFDQHSQTVTSKRVLQIFSKWSAACEKAGVEYQPAPERPYDLKWSYEDCLQAVRDFLATSPYGSYVNYEVWAKANPPKPSGGTLRNRIDRKWSNIREIALDTD